MRVLIIDDDQSHGESLVELLASRGHEAYFASSSGEAEWLAALFRFDITVIDFDMPHATGLEVARQLLGRSPDLEVVIISAHAGTLEHSLEHPFFPKPIAAGPFLAFLEGVLARRQGMPLMVREGFPLQRYAGGEKA